MTAVDLPDGRRLGYREYGPADGIPVVFIPGAGSGRFMRFGGDQLLADRGVRLISVDRPGLGVSTDDPAKTFASVAGDIAHLVQTIAGRPVVVIANSQGAPFGLALAATAWVSRLVLVSPIDDVGHPPTTAMLPEHHRGLVDAVAADPDAMEQDFWQSTAESLFTMVMREYPESDAEVYDRPDFRSMFRVAVQDAFASGANGYARDTVLAMTRWPETLFEPGVAVRILFGSEDSVHSPDLGATLTARIRGARRDVIAGTGGSLLWSHPGVVLDVALSQ